jgi:environmental stress-induced protein Ves
MNIYIHRKEELAAAEWSGGITTQLFIYPLDADYNKRDFIFRISTAKVEVEESAFTSLPEISRAIMVLDGEMEISHEGHHSKHLKKFDTDYFEGSWNTTSRGKVTDFNLMTNKNAKGVIEDLQLNNIEKQIDILPDYNVYSYYSYKGSFTVDTNNEQYNIKEGDIIIIFSGKREETLTLKCDDECEIIVSKVRM